MSKSRIWGIILRHFYNFRRNPDRLVDAFYWPLLNLILWGFTIEAVEKSGGGGGTWVQAVLFGTILLLAVVRVQGDITVNFLEELWSENIANVFASPLKLSEWITGLLIVSMVKLGATAVLSSIVAFLLYGANIFVLGWHLITFTLALSLMAWALAFFILGLFFRYGTNIQTLAWSGASVLTPFAAVYYPVSQLPEWVQAVSHLIPATPIFESMRSHLNNGTVNPTHILISFGLNAAYLTAALWYFHSSVEFARRNGIAHIK